MKLPLTAVIITKNEEANILRCLQSVSFASEIIVVDSGSTDKTIPIATDFGARVFQKEWLGFGPQKHWATNQASHDWILSLDADEAISKELEKELHIQFTQLDPVKGYFIPRISFFMRQWIKHGGWYPDYQLRLFHKKHSQWSSDLIHEKVLVPSGQTEKLMNPIQHYVFKNIEDQITTNNHYSGLLASQDYHSGKRFSYIRLLTKPLVKFLECYLVKLGFLDGFPGYAIAKNAAYSIFLRQIKLWEIDQKETQKH